MLMLALGQCEQRQHLQQRLRFFDEDKLMTAIYALIAIALYFLLTGYILPRLGVPT